jgi:hypothetical protein
MADTGNIRGYFRTVGKTHPGNFPQSGIRLFRGNRHYTGTYAPLLGTGLQSRRLRFSGNLLPAETNQLIDCGHVLKLPYKLYNNRLPKKAAQKTQYTKDKKKDQAVLTNFLSSRRRGFVGHRQIYAVSEAELFENRRIIPP